MNRTIYELFQKCAHESGSDKKNGEFNNAQFSMMKMLINIDYSKEIKCNFINL